MRLKEDESAVAPLLLILGLVGLGLGGGVVFAIAPHLMLIYFLFAGFFLIGIIALKSGPKTLKMIIPLFVSVVVLVLIFSFVPLPWLTITPPDFDTEMEQEEHYYLRGYGNENWEEGNSKNGELIDSTRYITSYKPEGESEKVVMQGRICNKASGLQIAGFVGRYRYDKYLYDGTWELEEKGQEYADASGVIIPNGGCRWLQAEVYGLDYGYSGYLKVELEVEIAHLGGKDWHTLAIDMAYVKEGIVSGEWSKDRYEVGETARFHYKVGYCSSSKHEDAESGGCTVSIYSYGQQKAVKTQSVSQNSEGDMDYIVVMADFDTSAGCQNMLKATISNDLIDIYEEYATVIDFAELGPSKPTIKTDKPNYNIGDNIEISIEAKPNSKTQLPIEKYHIRIYYTDPQVVMEDKWITSNTYIFSGTAEKGTIAIEVFCQDEGCRPSEITTKYVKIYDPNDPRGGLPIPWMVIILELLMVVLGIFILLYARFIPPIMRIIIFILLLLIPPALWWMGVIY